MLAVFCAAVLAVLVCVPTTGLAQTETGEETLLYSCGFENGFDLWKTEQSWKIIETTDHGAVLTNQAHTWARLSLGSLGRFHRSIPDESRIAGHSACQLPLNGGLRYLVGLGREQTYLSKQTGPGEFIELAAGPGMQGGWHDIEIAGIGGLITVRVDGVQTIQVNDPDPLLRGGLAFETPVEGMPVYIDNVEIWGQQPGPTPTAPADETWVRTGGPLGGLGYDVRMRPDNPDIMYVTDAYAGVFISNDAGQTWFPSNEGIMTRAGESQDGIPIFSLTIDPLNNDNIWVGTQYLRGIYKSTDGGATWQKKDKGVTESDITFRGFTVDPRSSEIVYAAAEISSWVYSANSGRAASSRWWGEQSTRPPMVVKTGRKSGMVTTWRAISGSTRATHR